ncbi:glycoside hydrolase family 26 protein [Mangrovihabitans endophyticus]|uniref:GH26 domain-containing protein n=1 Tax=Mangrovihabitans endophyticus TaxID=1751298 RepID=A0A8J3C0I6_9ACTN|nr:glycosyl hydrolase [Mangrovihabitans endophyticus]GGK91519.1 hypothetical protein GCM10012284_26740 [Mangrovihabitans endophyticus]
MSPSHRASARLSRRGMLGLAALAGLAAAELGLDRLRTDDRPAEASTGPAPPSASAGSAPPPSPSSAPLPRGDGGPVPFIPGKAMLGAYLDLEGLSDAQSQALRRRQLGRPERIVHVFYDWTDDLPRAVDARPSGAVPMVSWRGTAYDKILDGRYDAMIARAARRLIAQRRPVMLRWGWEMNGGWYPWGGAKNGENAEGFVRSWRRLHRIFADEGADNVAWVWSPNWNDSPDEEWNRMAHYYPGDAYVDWVGVSGYNLHHETPARLFDDFCAAYGPDKPVIITEVGAVDRGGRTKADWITLFAQWVRATPQVGGITWFDTDTHYSYPEKWRIDSDEASLAAYRAMADDPRFAG